MNRRSRGDWSQAGSLGFTLVGSVLVFTWLGYLADNWLHTRPWFMIIGVFVGGIMGFAYLVKTLFDGGRRRGPGDDDQDEDGDQGRGPW